MLSPSTHPSLQHLCKQSVANTCYCQWTVVTKEEAPVPTSLTQERHSATHPVCWNLVAGQNFRVDESKVFWSSVTKALNEAGGGVISPLVLCALIRAIALSMGTLVACQMLLSSLWLGWPAG